MQKRISLIVIEVETMKKFCENLKEHVIRIIIYEKKEMIPLTKREEKKHKKQKRCYICKKRLPTMTIKSIIK